MTYYVIYSGLQQYYDCQPAAILDVGPIVNKTKLLLFASNVFDANIANTIWTKRTVFTGSAIILPKVDRFG